MALGKGVPWVTGTLKIYTVRPVLHTAVPVKFAVLTGQDVYSENVRLILCFT